MAIVRISICLFCFLSSSILAHTSALRIDEVSFLREPGKDLVGVWKFTRGDKGTPQTFMPCLEVKLSTDTRLSGKEIVGKAYFYNQKDEMIAHLGFPSLAGSRTSPYHYRVPAQINADQQQRIFFSIPEDIRETQWKAVVVAGTIAEYTAMAFPKSASYFNLRFPERNRLKVAGSNSQAEQKPSSALDEEVVNTGNPKMPKITIFFKRPLGTEKIKGVLAICVLAAHVDRVRYELSKPEMEGDYRGLLEYASKNNLAVIAWGARTLWDKEENTSELNSEQQREFDRSFDQVAGAWSRGVEALCKRNSVAPNRFLAWGCSGSAQWVMRLCLRKPQYFSAVYLHIPSSFDKPTKPGSAVMWCLTTGELEAGYERSKKFVNECRKLEYPLIYKAVPGLGHKLDEGCRQLCFQFYDFALKINYSNSVGAALTRDFYSPPFFGDMVNQGVYPASEVDLIPESFRVPLPTSEIARVWEGS